MVKREYKAMILWIYGAAPELLASPILQTSHTTNAPIGISDPPLVPANRCGTLNPRVRDVDKIKHLVPVYNIHLPDEDGSPASETHMVNVVALMLVPHI